MARPAEPHAEAFLEMISAERGASANTLAAYRRDLEQFATFLAGRGGEAVSADSQAIRDYLAGLAGRGLSAATSARRLSSLRQFYRFLFDEGVRGDDPSAAIDSPRRARPLPKVLSEDEVDRLLGAARMREGPQGIRLVALLEVLYATGLRVSELVGLPLSALAGDPRLLLVRGKGDKERLVPLGEPAKAALAEYRGTRDRFLPEGECSKWLFPSRGRSGHLTRRRFGQLLKELAVLAPSGGQ